MVYNIACAILKGIKERGRRKGDSLIGRGFDPRNSTRASSNFEYPPATPRRLFFRLSKEGLRSGLRTHTRTQTHEGRASYLSFPTLSGCTRAELPACASSFSTIQRTHTEANKGWIMYLAAWNRLDRFHRALVERYSYLLLSFPSLLFYSSLVLIS
jgi:hypothetical protein